MESTFLYFHEHYPDLIVHVQKQLDAGFTPIKVRRHAERIIGISVTSHAAWLIAHYLVRKERKNDHQKKS